MAVEARSFLSLMLGGLLFAATPAPPPQSDQPPQLSGGLLCTDDMETEPFSDDFEAVPVAEQVDGGCQVSQEPIST